MSLQDPTRPLTRCGDNAVLMADIAKQYEERWIDAELEATRILKELDKLEEPYRSILIMRYIERQKA